jgi:8-oxo-dGTP pyrophosphatase MutT (NUDIX family)
MRAEEWTAAGLAARLRPALGEAPSGEGSDSLKPAAVMVPLLDVDGRAALLFLRRTVLLPDHGGQVAFPGGMHDPADADLYATALREAAEEVAVDPAAITRVGALEPVTTLAKYRIQPYLSLWPAGPYAIASPSEVARIFTVPLAWLADPAHTRECEVAARGQRLRVPAWSWQGEIIWGATRRITLDLLARVVA